MKNLINSNFNPKKIDIFDVDTEGTLSYTFLWKKYTIDNIKQEKEILKIESYKPYILSTKPPIFIPIIILSFIISILYVFISEKFVNIKSIILYNTLGLYALILFIYYIKIYLVLKMKK